MIISTFCWQIQVITGVIEPAGMMPNNGGFLDRFESMLPATPVVWLFMMVFG